MIGIGDVVEHARRGIVVATTSGEIRYLNDWFTEVTGLLPNQVLGHSYEAFVYPDDLPLEADLFGRVASGEMETYDRRCRLRTAGDAVRWFRVSVTAVSPRGADDPAWVMAALVLDGNPVEPHAPVWVQDGRIMVREGSSILVLLPDELEAVQAEGGHSVLRTTTGPELVRVPLRSFETALADISFFRVHRSTLVDLEKVRALRPLSRGDAEVRLRSGVRFRVARSRREKVEQALRTSRWRRLPR